MRKHLSQILETASIEINREYSRLYEMFYKTYAFGDNETTLEKLAAANFINVPFRGTCISLEDFNISNGFYFEESPRHFDIDYLILFCEYTYNLTIHLEGAGFLLYQSPNASYFISLYLRQVSEVMDKIGFMPNNNGRITDFVEKDAAAISVAEITDESLAYRILEYNHHSLKGDIVEKKNILLAIYDKMASNEKKLRNINKNLADNLAFVFNNLNLRHNNIDTSSEDYKEIIANLSKQELEDWYDDIYQLCLLAILEVDNVERNQKIKKLKQELKGEAD